MDDRTEAPSPWWYRRRAVVIGAVYGAGFFLGSLLRIDETAPKPAAVTWGERIGGGDGIQALLWLAVVLAMLAWLVRASGTAYLRYGTVFARDVQRDRLVVAGPFRFVRNPLYVGNMFLALGIGLLAPPLGFAFIVAGNAFVVVCLAREEAVRLRARYGAVFDAYARAVPAFVPRLTPADVAGTTTAEPSLASAMVGELPILGMALSLVPVAIAGKGGLAAFWIIWIASVAAAAGINWWSGRRRPGTAR